MAFPQGEKVVNETHFELVQDIQIRVTGVLKDLKTEAFEECLRASQRRMRKCSKFMGEYSEGETGEIPDMCGDKGVTATPCMPLFRLL